MNTGIPIKDRNEEIYHHIDAGFINKRLCFSVFGQSFSEIFNERKIEETDHWGVLSNTHLFVDLAIAYCKQNNVQSLGIILSDLKKGSIFCSTETCEGTDDDLYEAKRVKNRILLPYYHEKRVILNFGTEHFVADTGRVEQEDKNLISLIGLIRDITDTEVIVQPLIMGAPLLNHPKNSHINDQLLWWCRWEMFEIFPEEIDQFSQIKNCPDPEIEEWQDYMKKTSENDIKLKLTSLFNDTTKKDWGGEMNDHFSTSLTIEKKRYNTAFLLKGPANFREMTLDMCGKRANQIVRLSKSPANLLVVQHCHNVSEDVRETLKKFAVTPSSPRKYCIIDGKDTYKILKCYNLL